MKIKDLHFSIFMYTIFTLLTILTVFDEKICTLITSLRSENLTYIPLDSVVAQFDKVLYYLLFGYFILSLLYIAYTENKNIKNKLHRLFPGLFCLLFPFLFQLIILRYQYVFNWDDAGHYVSIGMNLFSGYGLSSSISGALGGAYFPFLPFPVYQHGHYLFSILFGLFWEISHSLKGIMLSIVLVQSINCFLLYKISKKTIQSNFLSVGISLFYLSIVLYSLPQSQSLQPIFDHPFSTIVFLLLLMLNAELAVPKKAFFFGLLLGVGILVKVTSLFVGIVLMLTVFLSFSQSFKNRFHSILSISAGLLILFIPYQIYCLQSQGKIFPSKYTSSSDHLDFTKENRAPEKILLYENENNPAENKKLSNSTGNEETLVFLSNRKRERKLGSLFPWPNIKKAFNHESQTNSDQEEKKEPLGKIDVISPQGDEIVGPRPSFLWTKIKGAKSYEIEIFTDGGAKIDSIFSKKTESKTPDDLPPTRLCWRVRAINKATKGPWSIWAYFSPLDRLEQPNVIWPKEDEGENLRPTLRWDEVESATSYDLEIITDGGRKVKNLSSKKTSKKIEEDLPITRLSWRVRAKKEGELGPWSPWAQFKIMRPRYIQRYYYYSRMFPYFAIMALSILLFILYAIFNKAILKNFSLFFSVVFILVYSVIILWLRSFEIVLLRHFFAPAALSFIIILFILANMIKEKKTKSPKENLKKFYRKKIYVLYSIVFLISGITLWSNIQKNCSFIGDKWKYKNQIIGGIEGLNYSNIIEWIRNNTRNHDLISFQFDDVGAVHILTERPFIVFPRVYDYETSITFLEYYKPRYLIIHNENIGKTPLRFNETIEKACRELNYTPLEIIDRHKIWYLQ